MTKTTRIVCLCILGAVGTLCGVSTINAPVTEDKIEMITPTEPLRSAYIVADMRCRIRLQYRYKASSMPLSVERSPSTMATTLSSPLVPMCYALTRICNHDNTPNCTGNYLDTRATKNIAIEIKHILTARVSF